MTRIFKPSWSNAPLEAPITVGQEHRAETRALRLPKGSITDELAPELLASPENLPANPSPALPNQTATEKPQATAIGTSSLASSPTPA